MSPQNTERQSNPTEVSSNEGRKFRCDTCQRLFNRREHLQRHERIHFGHKPFHCTICRYSCRRRDLLNRHVKLAHSKKPGKEAARPPMSPSHEQSFSDSSNQQARPSLPLCSLSGPENGAVQTLQIPNNITCPPSSALEQPEVIQRLSEHTVGEGNVPTDLLEAPFLSSQPVSRSFPFSYLDSVCLPPLFEQAAFYPGLSINDPLLSPIFTIDGNQPEQTTIADGQMRGGPGRFVQASLPHSENECQHLSNPSFLRISQDDWQWLDAQISQFSSILPTECRLPSRHAISRYIHGFMTGFHPHFPIIHPQTLLLRQMAPELILAIAAVGSQYCLESHQGLKLFPVAKAIAMEQLRRRDAERDAAIHISPGSSWTLIQSPQYQPDSTPQDHDILGAGNTTQYQSTHADTETMQALFFLMAMATWGGEHRSLVRQAIATQSVLAMLVRQHGLSEQSITPTTWEEWARVESARRTKLIIFSFFNLHAITFNLPSPLLVADIQLRIPCTEPEWRCPDSASWFRLYGKSTPPFFQDCIRGLLHEGDAMPAFSSLGGHVLIHALLQRIICIQQSIRMESMEKHIIPGLSPTLKQALNKWQNAWEENPESSYSPLDKYGPIAFNSRALYHLAHIRLALDIGSARSLLEQSPNQLARRLQEGPKIERGPHLLLAAKHATAALCSPVQMGVHFVGRAPSWSVMHAVCSLEYAYILNQFIQAVIQTPVQCLEEDEKALFDTIKETLCEVETASATGNPTLIETEPKMLGTKAVRAWAIILDGMRTWNAVYLITKTLFLYAELLERDAFVNEPPE